MRGDGSKEAVWGSTVAQATSKLDSVYDKEGAMFKGQQKRTLMAGGEAFKSIWFKGLSATFKFLRQRAWIAYAAFNVGNGGMECCMIRRRPKARAGLLNQASAYGGVLLL